MSSAAERLRGRHLRRFEFPPKSGCVYWLKPIVSRDMLSTHKGLLLALLPATDEDRILVMEIEELTKEAGNNPQAAERLKEAEKRLAAHLIRTATDPKVAEDTWNFNISCLQAAVVGLSEGDGPMTAIRLVDGAGDDQAVPELVPLDVLDLETMEALVSEIRQMSFGGRVGADAAARFRGGSGHGADGR